mgnify:FL=1
MAAAYGTFVTMRYVLLALLASACTRHTVVIERVRVERLPGAPCMDPPPPIDVIDWPSPDAITGEVTLDVNMLAEVMIALQAPRYYILKQYDKCRKIAAGEPLSPEEIKGDDGFSLACRPETGEMSKCVVPWRGKLPAPPRPFWILWP